MRRSRTLSIFTVPICQQHSHRTERAITKALFRYNLSTTSSPPAKRNQNWGMQKQTGLLEPRRGLFETLEVKKGKGKVRESLQTGVCLNCTPLGSKEAWKQEAPLWCKSTSLYCAYDTFKFKELSIYSQNWYSLHNEHPGLTPPYSHPQPSPISKAVGFFNQGNCFNPSNIN